jgi:hypothetical protein
MSDDPIDDIPLDSIEARADAWAERINLNAMIENALSPTRLSTSVPADIRAQFNKRMKEQVDAIVRQAFIEGAVHALDGFVFVEEPSEGQ